MKKSFLVQIVLSMIVMVNSYAQMDQVRTYLDSNGSYVELPLGALSFVDKVTSFAPQESFNPYFSDPSKVLGAPNTKMLSLGCGGVAVFEFTDNTLVNVQGDDLYIFSYSAKINSTAIAISKDAKKWIDVGKVLGSKLSVDIAPFVEDGETFNFIRLMDLNESCQCGALGASIDAIAAVGSGVTVSLSSTILFDSGKFALKGDASVEIDKKIKTITSIERMNCIVEGHTDNVGTETENLALSLKRATAVKEYLITTKKIDAAHIMTKSLGESVPIASNNTDVGREKNRSVSIVFMAQESKSSRYELPVAQGKYILSISKEAENVPVLYDANTKQKIKNVSVHDTRVIRVVYGLNEPLYYTTIVKPDGAYFYVENSEGISIEKKLNKQDLGIYPIDDTRFYISTYDENESLFSVALYDINMTLLSHYEKPVSVTQKCKPSGPIHFYFDEQKQLVFTYASNFIAFESTTYKPIVGYTPPTDKKSTVILKGQLWSGTYVCIQGKTDLNLSITAVNKEKITAIFDFNYDKGKAEGKYELFGSYDARTKILSFDPGNWLENPNNYIATSIHGRVENNIYQGQVLHNTCTTFELMLVPKKK